MAWGLFGSMDVLVHKYLVSMGILGRRLLGTWIFWHRKISSQEHFSMGTFGSVDVPEHEYSVSMDILEWRLLVPGHYRTEEFWRKDITAHGCFGTGKFWECAERSIFSKSPLQCQNVPVPKGPHTKISMCRNVPMSKNLEPESSCA